MLKCDTLCDWYHLFNLKSVKKTHRGVILLVKLQAELSQSYHSSMSVFNIFKIVQMLPNRAKRLGCFVSFVQCSCLRKYFVFVEFSKIE